MLDFFKDGGYAMYPTLLFGVLFVLASARDLRARRVRTGLGALTLLMGAAGFVMGVRVSLEAAGEAGLVNAAMLGISESIANLVLAFCLVAIGVAVATVRAWRTAAEA